MEIRPILSAMRRNKVGAILVAVQMAVTLAILCNALFIIEQRLKLSERPSGTDEANLFAISNQWVGQPEDLAALTQADLETLRSMPGVVDAYATNSYPLTNSGWGDGADISPTEHLASVHMARYFSDEHTINTLGLRLIEGRNFTAAEIGEKSVNSGLPPTALIVTRAMADGLFPHGNALGQRIYTSGNKAQSAPIIGIVERLQIPWVSSTSWAKDWTENSMLEPVRFVSQNSYYVVRTQPGQLAALMRASQDKLFQVHGGRVLDKVQSFGEARREVYRDDRGLALILGVVCVILLAVTAFGILGLTSYWVAQRRRQIGIRRALGATRANIVRYFQTENLMIAAAGAALGVGLAIAINLWMVSSFEMERLHLVYAVIGAVVVLLLGQAAVLWPALRAASIPPALATRSA
jgi:putative ABC transport system permease protein